MQFLYHTGLLIKITFYFILEGAFNGNVKFVFYLVGLFIAIMLGILLRGGGSLKTNMADPMKASSDAQEFVRKCKCS